MHGVCVWQWDSKVSNNWIFFIFKDDILALLQSQKESKTYNVQMGYAGIPFEYKAINIATGEHLSEGIDISFSHTMSK